jgi:hypothetical protein
MDQRNAIERTMDRLIGPPLYYCADCLRAVKVGGDPVVIERPCGPECGTQVMAPRKSVLAGEGGLNFAGKVKMSWLTLTASLTGRCV